MYLKWWSQKFGKHQVKSPCSSSTIYAYTQFHQPHIKTARKLCHVHSRITSWKTRSFKLHHLSEILLQSKGIFRDICEAAPCRHSMWMQVFASSPISTLLTGIRCGCLFFSLPLSTLLHSLLHICNSYILLSTLNFSSIPIWKGRALSSPPVTFSQIPHKWSPTESWTSGLAFLKQFIKRSNYCKSGFLAQWELWKTVLSEGKLPFTELLQQGCTVPLRLKNIFRVRLCTFKIVSNFVTAELFPNIAKQKCPVSS